MKHPKFTREENRACKLTDKQIDEIKTRRLHGESYPNIAKDYNITVQAVYYWCLSDEDRKEKNKKNNSRPAVTFYDYKEYRRRKLECHPELRDYEIFSTHRFRKEKPEQAKLVAARAGHNRWIRHKDKLQKKNKEYQLNHLDKFREYNRRHREKIKLQHAS